MGIPVMLQNNAATCLLVLAVILRLFVHASDICLWVVVSGAYFGNVYWVVMGADWHRCSIGTNEPVVARTDNTAALGGLQDEYQ